MKLLKSVKNKIEAEVERVAGDKHCVNSDLIKIK